MRPGPAAAAGVVASYVSLDMPPRRTAAILADIIRGEGWGSLDSEVQEKAEAWEKRFVENLRRSEGALNARGGHCGFTFNSSDNELLQGACYLEGNESDVVREAKRRRLAHGELLAALQQLTPAQFEDACRGMLVAMGVADAQVTRRAADNGIDFFGRLSLDAELRRAVGLPGVYTTLRPWMVGQAKHYIKGQAATPDLRELVGSVQLARAGAYPSRGPTHTFRHKGL